MAGELDELDVGFVAISPDGPDDVDRFQAKESLSLTILADPDLAVTDLYNLRSYKTGTLDPKRGLVRYLAIPTTILVDAGGVVRWIDQSTDYRVRSEPARILPELRRILGA